MRSPRALLLLDGRTLEATIAGRQEHQAIFVLLVKIIHGLHISVLREIHLIKSTRFPESIDVV